MPKTSRKNLEVMEEQCMQYIEESGARLDMQTTGVHYLLTSGYHSEFFFNMARAFERYTVRNYLAQFFLRKIKAAGINPPSIDVLCGPATGALPLLYTLQGFPDFEHTRVIYVERRGEDFILSRGFEIQDDDQILVIDDVSTTFGSLRKTIKVLQEHNGFVRGAGVFIDRSPNGKKHITEQALGLQFVCGIRASLSYIESDCPHCKAEIKLIKV